MDSTLMECFNVDRVQENTVVLEDNMPAISLAHNEQTKRRTKHLSVKLRFVFQNIQSGNIQVDHISSAHNTADMMTKSLSKRLFIGHRMQVVCSTDPATRGSVQNVSGS